LTRSDPADQPSVKVLEYSAKHWISTSDFRHLQAVQISKVEASLAPIGGVQRLIEQSTKATSRYRYDKAAIEIPEDAQKILTLDSLPLQKTESVKRVVPTVAE
jgi:hypothetical protein